MEPPHSIDLVHQLHEVMYGYRVATPETPQEAWVRLLTRVAQRFCACPPTTPPERYDCDRCAALHRITDEFRFDRNRAISRTAVLGGQARRRHE